MSKASSPKETRLLARIERVKGIQGDLDAAERELAALQTHLDALADELDDEYLAFLTDD